MKTTAGFTLVELLVVVLIISVLATIVAVNVWDKPGKARQAAARAQITNFRTALKMYSMENGGIPTQEQGLAALCQKPAAPPVPETYPADGYLDSRAVPKDPWGNDYVYLVPGSHGERFEIICYGGDGAPGGEGEAQDLTSYDL